MEDAGRARGAVQDLLAAARRWAAKGTFGLADQLLFSASGFLINVLAGRWLGQAQYGAFAVAQSVFLLLASLYTAALIEPMTVFGASRYRGMPGYFGVLFFGHWALTAAMSLILGLAILALLLAGSRLVALGLTGVAFSLPCVLLFWYVRRGLYVTVRSTWSAVVSGCYLVLSLLTMIWLRLSGSLTLSTVFLAMALAGLTAGGGFLVLLAPDLRLRGRSPGAAAVLRDHWRYGGWNLLATGVYWASSQILLVLMPLFLGLEANAAYAAVTNLFRPLSLLMQSTGLLLLPALASWMDSPASRGRLLARAKTLAIVFSGVAFFYGLLVWAFSGSILHLLYAGRYDGYRLLVLFIALSSVASVAGSVMSLILKAGQDTRSVTGVWVWSAILMACLAVPLIKLWALAGAAATATLSYALSAVVAWIKVKALPARGEARGR
jgi:O-antigen/teichoic acid export membrane protein